MATSTGVNTVYPTAGATTNWWPTWGGRVGQLNNPVSTFGQLNQNVPGFTANNQAASNDISSMLNGVLSPETIGNISNTAASRGVSLGQPNSPISNSIDLSLTGNTSEGLQSQGITDFGNMASILGGEQLSPETQYETQLQNALDSAAPDPKAAGGYATWLLQQQLDAGNANQGIDQAASGLSSFMD